MDDKYHYSLQYLIKNNMMVASDDVREELNHLLGDLKILSEMDWENINEPTQQFIQYYANNMVSLLIVWEAMDKAMGKNQTIH